MSDLRAFLLYHLGTNLQDINFVNRKWSDYQIIIIISAGTNFFSFAKTFLAKIPSKIFRSPVLWNWLKTSRNYSTVCLYIIAFSYHAICPHMHHTQPSVIYVHHKQTRHTHTWVYIDTRLIKNYNYGIKVLHGKATSWPREMSSRPMHPFLVGLHYSFWTSMHQYYMNLYFVLDYMWKVERYLSLQRKKVFRPRECLNSLVPRAYKRRGHAKSTSKNRMGGGMLLEKYSSR